MQSIFSHAYWSPACPLGRNVYASPLPIFKSGSLVSCYRGDKSEFLSPYKTYLIFLSFDYHVTKTRHPHEQNKWSMTSKVFQKWSSISKPSNWIRSEPSTWDEDPTEDKFLSPASSHLGRLQFVVGGNPLHPAPKLQLLKPENLKVTDTCSASSCPWTCLHGGAAGLP